MTCNKCSQLDQSAVTIQLPRHSINLAYNVTGFPYLVARLFYVRCCLFNLTIDSCESSSRHSLKSLKRWCIPVKLVLLEKSLTNQKHAVVNAMIADSPQPTERHQSTIKSKPNEKHNLLSDFYSCRETDEGIMNPRHPRPLTLCLHKRDFLPGNWIVDNIMSAMERSRRTIFVLSENFVQSDWCRYELDFSHFWLFDGDSGRDAAILILLEPLSKDDVPKRFCKLRKLMSSTTYLEWPQEEEKVEGFWRSLRHALRGEEEEDD